jgi:hypothetical protein
MDVEGIDPVAVDAALISTVALGWQSWKEHQARRPRVEVKIRWRWSAIASSNNRSVLVFVHFIKLAFTIGIESSFQGLERGSPVIVRAMLITPLPGRGRAGIGSARD